MIGTDIEFNVEPAESTLLLAKRFWSSKPELAKLGDVRIALAPHTVLLAECCSIAIDKYCVVIGTAEDKVPEDKMSHLIKDSDLATSLETIEIIRLFLDVLNLQKTFTFHIEGMVNAGNITSYVTILAALWKFICNFQIDLKSETRFRKLVKNVLAAHNISVLDGEIESVLFGSKSNGFLSGFIENGYQSTDGQTKLESVNTEVVFSAYDFIHIRTDLSTLSHFSKDRYFKKSHQKVIKEAFAAEHFAAVNLCDSDDDDDDQGIIEADISNWNSLGRKMLMISSSRVTRNDFQGSEHEQYYQIVLDEIIKNNSGIVQGGEVQRSGIILVVLRGTCVRKEHLATFANAFLNKSMRSKHIVFEKLRNGDSARTVSNE